MCVQLFTNITRLHSCVVLQMLALRRVVEVEVDELPVDSKALGNYSRPTRRRNQQRICCAEYLPLDVAASMNSRLDCQHYCRDREVE